VYKNVRFQVLTAATMKVTVFWDIAPCSLVQIDRRFKGVSLMMELVSLSETSANFHETTRRNIPEYCQLHIRRRENLISFRFTVSLQTPL
jgi:hypothetical protein